MTATVDKANPEEEQAADAEMTDAVGLPRDRVICSVRRLVLLCKLAGNSRCGKLAAS
jgi:hypothetical protein